MKCQRCNDTLQDPVRCRVCGQKHPTPVSPPRPFVPDRAPGKHPTRNGYTRKPRMVHADTLRTRLPIHSNSPCVL